MLLIYMSRRGYTLIEEFAEFAEFASGICAI